MDTGAQSSVPGRHQVKAYRQYRGITFVLQPSSTKFKFVEWVTPSLCELSISVPIPDKAENMRLQIDFG